jgi:putative SOS response-associated peptidase YedK
MCGRYVLTEDHTGIYPRFYLWSEFSRETWKQLFEEGRVVEVKPSYNIAPTQHVPIVFNREGSRHIELARWSYVPPWWDFQKNEGKYPGFATFNARDDKLKSSGTWRGALNQYRCMVPASGFYEWEKKGKQRLPYYIHRKDGDMIAFAGLYSHYTHRETGESTASFTIITTPTNSLMEPLHDRIPLVLGSVDDELWSVWLDPQTKFDDVQQHVKPREWPEMTMHRVSTDVNPTGKANYVNDPRLIEPLKAQIG